MEIKQKEAGGVRFLSINEEHKKQTLVKGDESCVKSQCDNRRGAEHDSKENYFGQNI